MSACLHDEVMGEIDISRIHDNGKPAGYLAELRIRCTKCGSRFKFVGLPRGLNMNGAAVSANREQARLAIEPGEMPS